MLKTPLAIFMTLMFISLIAVVQFGVQVVQQPLNLPANSLNYQVPAGASISRVLEDFEQQGWLKHAKIHILWLRKQQKTNIQRGEYLLDRSLTSVAAIEKMIAGDKLLSRIQFIEGQSFADFLQVIANTPDIKQTLTGLSRMEVLKQVAPELEHYEGWFFPDTYYFEKGMSDVALLKLMHSQMQQELAEQWQQRSPDSIIQTPYEALILASIIEKETGLASERAEIAGVFTRRLNLGMRLQTDPTVIYGLERFDGNLTRQDLRADHPYNTYRYGGLPPTPIANPGRDAIAAALNPQAGDSLYFVAKGDGSHQFSQTLAEHNAAVRKYQRFNRRQDYQSRPQPTQPAN